MAAGVQLDTELVDLKTHTTASGVDFYTINKKGNVPTLVLTDGTVLNENSAVLQWIADQKPCTVAPALQTTARYKLINTLNYIASEVHPNIAGLFNTTLGPEVRAHVTANAYRRLAFLDNELAASPFLMGASPTIADYYLYLVLSWTAQVGLSLDNFKNVHAFSTRVSELDPVKTATARMATNPKTTLPLVSHHATGHPAPRAPPAVDPVDQPTMHCMP